MKVVILAGGLGTRLSEETVLKPKPMVEIGDKPILWHIMKIYAHYGFNEFVICLGYKGYYIKEWFNNYFLHNSDVTFDFGNNTTQYHKHRVEDWKVTLVDTGKKTMTGGRIKRVKDYLNNEPFFLTYGDGVSDVNIKELLDFHRQHGKKITLTSVQPAGRFGALQIETNQKVSDFIEKPRGDSRWINGGFFVCEPEVIDYISNDETVFEQIPLKTLAQNNELYAYKHNGFWQCMDTLSNKKYLNELWKNNEAQWQVWS